MKLKRMISILLVLCMVLPLTACMSAGTNPTETQTVPTTTIPVTTTTAPPPTTTEAAPTSLCLNGYETGIDSSVINEDTFVALLRQADALLKQYETLTYDATGMKYLRRIPWACGINLKGMRMMEMNKTHDIYTSFTLYADTVTEKYREDALYWVLNVLLIETYDDCCTHSDIPSLDYLSEGGVMNDDPYDAMIICPDYKDYGYETIEDVSRAYCRGENEAVFYCISDTHTIKTYARDPRVPNLYSDIFAKAFPDE